MNTIYIKIAYFLLVLAGLALGLLSCTPQKKLQRLIRKHPELMETKVTYDTIVTDSVYTDTVFQFNRVRDTVVLQKERLTVKYFYNNSDSTVYLSGECESDTIVVEKIINTVRVEKSLCDVSIWGLALVFLLIGFFYGLWKNRKA